MMEVWKEFFVENNLTTKLLENKKISKTLIFKIVEKKSFGRNDIKSPE